MAAHRFDTLEYSKKMKKAGFTDEQAEVQAEELNNFINDNIVTKENIKEVEAKLGSNIKELEVKLESNIKELELKINLKGKELEVSLIKWMVGISLTQAALILTIVGFMINHLK